jgi:HPt (histidine-containing phosphotransfer) domain-containing protein
VQRFVQGGIDGYVDRLFVRGLPVEAIERIDWRDPAMTGVDGSGGGAYGVDQLLATIGNDNELAAQVASTFLQVRAELRARLRAAAAAEDAVALTNAAHELKGMAAMIGAERLSLAAKTLEQAGRGGNRAAFTDAALLAGLDDEWGRVARVLEALTPRD